MPPKDTWYRLDNAARLYPAIRDMRDSTYRISAELCEDVEPEVLREALKKTLPRFPTFCVRLKRGYFWYYLEHNDNPPPMEEECDYPCSNIRAADNGGFLFKIVYYKTRISAEVFHSISDGLGTVEFLRTLVYEYLLIKGYPVSDEGMIKVADEAPKPYEAEDSFEKYYNHGDKKKRRDSYAYRIEGVLMKRGEMNLVTGSMEIRALLDAAKRRGATLTAYLTAVYIYAIYKDQRLDLGTKKPVRIMIPKNLRVMFPSATLRNFISHIIVGIKFDGAMSFDDMLSMITVQMRELSTKEEMSQRINTNVDIARNIWIRMVPLGFKDMGIRAAYKFYGEKLYTAVLSNISEIKLPESVKPYVRDFHCALGATDLLPIKMTLCSYNGKCNITFARCIEQSDIIKEFFRFLANEEGLKINITGNGWRE